MRQASIAMSPPFRFQSTPRKNKEQYNYRKVNSNERNSKTLYKEKLNWERWSVCFKNIIENINSNKK